MTEELAARAVGEGPVVSEFVNLTYVVQEGSGKQEVAVDLRIVTADRIAGAAERDYMIEQAANIGVVQGLGGWSHAIRLGNFGIGHEGLNQRLEVNILKAGDIAGQRLPQLADVFRSLGQVIGEIDFRIPETTELMDSDLKSILVFVEQALDLDEVILLESVQGILHVVPHLGFDVAGAITERQRQVRFTRFFGLHLFDDDDEARGNDFVFVLDTIAYKEVFHDEWCRRLRKLAPVRVQLN